MHLSAQDYTQGSRNMQRQNDQEGTPKQKKERIPYPNKKRGTSFGIDVSKFLLPVLDENRFGLEASIRTNFKKRSFLVGELGSESISFTDKSYHYDSDGAYARFGIDYDIFIVDEEGNNDNILIGFRYAIGYQQHDSKSITIKDPYWGDFNTSISRYGVSTHWIELIGGLRTEVFNNVYMSWYGRIKGKIGSNNKKIMKPYRVPGYGKGSKGISLGFSYTIEYLIPWGNKKNK